MKISNVDGLTPLVDMVIVEIADISTELLETQRSFEEGHIALRYGKVLSKGPDTDLPEHCRGLQVGDVAVFSEFAGFYLATTEGMYKAVRGYDIVAIRTNMDNMSNESFKPTANRLLIEELEDQVDENGLVMTEKFKDPRLQDLKFGRILDVGIDVANHRLAVGKIVGYGPYVGNDIREYESAEAPALKTIVEFDVLMILE